MESKEIKIEAVLADSDNLEVLDSIMTMISSGKMRRADTGREGEAVPPCGSMAS